MGRYDRIVTAARNRVLDAVEPIIAVCIRDDSTYRLAVRSLQRHVHSCHAAVVRHKHLTGYLSVMGTPSDRSSTMLRLFSVAIIHRSHRIFIPLLRSSREVEETVLDTGVERIGYPIAVLRHAGQDISVHGQGRGLPVELYPAFAVPFGISLRSRELR